jgi:hypothetical protein
VEKLRGVTSIEKVFQSATPTLFVIAQSAGREKAKAWIEAWILMLTDFVNITRSMPQTQLQITADLSLERFSLLTIADIHLVFRRAMAGDYGQLYNRLDGTLILGWFRSYFDERCEKAEAISISQHNRIKALEQDNLPRVRTDDKIKQTKAVYAEYLRMKSKSEIQTA